MQLNMVLDKGKGKRVIGAHPYLKISRVPPGAHHEGQRIWFLTEPRGILTQDILKLRIFEIAFEFPAILN